MVDRPARAPDGLKAAGRRLWKAVAGAFDLEPHERELLREVCRTADLIDGLQTVLDAEGPMAESSQGIRVHPAAVELRQQRITYARLVAALGVPTGVLEDRPAVGAPRGVYGLRAVD